jgi:CheY-like chemotaxis protein
MDEMQLGSGAAPEMSRILVIDDEADFRKMVRRMLEIEGHEVIEASNGIEGLDKFRALAPELIVTDIFMPEKSGYETIMQIRAEAPDIRIIAISGSGGIATADFFQAAKEAGADQALAKPFRPAQLIDAVDEQVKRTAAASSTGD